MTFVYIAAVIVLLSGAGIGLYLFFGLCCHIAGCIISKDYRQKRSRLYWRRRRREMERQRHRTYIPNDKSRLGDASHGSSSNSRVN